MPAIALFILVAAPFLAVGGVKLYQSYPTNQQITPTASLERDYYPPQE